MDKYLVVTVIFAIITKSGASKILAIFPTPSISHQIVFRPIVNELVKRGHEVVVITPNPAYSADKVPPNLTEIDVHNESYYLMSKGVLPAVVGKQNDAITQFKIAVEAFLDIFESQLQNKLVKELIENKNNNSFDLLLSEAYVRAALAFSHVYKAPVISISSSSPMYEINAYMGVPWHPFLFPNVPHQRLYNLTYWEKIKQLHLRYYWESNYNTFQKDEMKVLKKYFGPELPSYNELFDNVHMYMQNVNSFFMDNIPVPPSVVYLGGLQLKPAKPLPKDLEVYLNNSINGVIYVSFGTNVKTSLVSLEKIQMMVNVFSKVSYDVLWKMDSHNLQGIADNIKVSTWLPQADLLRHPKIKAFVTQAGLQSTDEAIAAGVPLIGIPFVIDQWFNSEKYVKHKIGLYLNWNTLTEIELMEAITMVTEDASYRENIMRYRAIINDQPQASLERAIWWIEYVLRHGGARHLRAPAANMSWTEYYELNLVLIVVFIFILMLLSLLLLLYFLKIWLGNTVSNVFIRSINQYKNSNKKEKIK